MTRGSEPGALKRGAAKRGAFKEGAVEAALRPKSRNSRRPKRRGSTKRSSRPLIMVRRAWVWGATGAPGVMTRRRPVMPRWTIHWALGSGTFDDRASGDWALGFGR